MRGIYWLAMVMGVLCLWPTGAMAEGKRVAVLELRGPLEKPVRALLTDKARAGILDATRGKDFIVMSRENMVAFAREMKLDLTCVEGECEVETGRNLGAGIVVSGEIIKMGEWLLCTVKIHDTGTGALLATDDARSKDPMELIGAVRTLSKGLMQQALGEPVTVQAPKPPPVAPPVAQGPKPGAFDPANPPELIWAIVVTEDQRREATRARKSCMGGDHYDCAVLAYIMEKGMGVVGNPSDVVDIYRFTCEAGVGAGCAGLGFMYDTGKGVAKDTSQAFRHYNTGCQKGSPRACVNLSITYNQGDGVAKNCDAAWKLMQRAVVEIKPTRAHGRARQGYAMHGVAQYYERGGNGGCSDLFPKDEDKARYYYQKACSLGEERGCQELK